MRVVSTPERRARLARRHLLAEPATTPEEVADALVALHASDPATVFLSVLARMDPPSIEAVERALYRDRSMLRVLAMRRTLFVGTIDALPILEQSSSVDVAASERRRLEGYLADSGIDEPGAFLEEAAEAVDRALAGKGLSARRITAAAPILATRVVMGAGAKHSVETGATSRALNLFATEGRIVRGRPVGTWTGRQYEWHRRRDWLDAEPMAIDPERAASELLRRWLERFGPGTMTDLRWWTGWTVKKTRAALAQLDTVEVELDEGGTGHVLLDDLDPVEDPEPWVAMLPSLDPTPMGWKERDWYLGGLATPLFDRNGNIGPTLWSGGRIVGGWSQTPSGDIATRLLVDVGAEAASMIEAEAERLTAAIGPVAVKPSFPTPLQKELAAPS